MLGRPDLAAKGELNILVGGAASAVDRTRASAEVIGGRIWDMCTDGPMANVATKVACNIMITMAIKAMAETVVLTEATVHSRDQFSKLILCTRSGSRSYQVYSANIASETYEPSFKATLGLKDLSLRETQPSEPGTPCRCSMPRIAGCAGYAAELVRWLAGPARQLVRQRRLSD